MDVSIIIVNYNTKDLTLQCLKSIFAQTENIEFEIIVIDNASSDGSCSLLQENFPQVNLIQSDKNLGFGRANNLGAIAAQGKYLFFLNSDTILLNNSILAQFNFNEKNANRFKIGISGGILLDENRLETGSFGPLPSKTNILKSTIGFVPRFTKMTSKEIKSFHTNGYLEVGYITGADMFISKSTFNSCGGFDPNIFMYYEETDLQLRLKKLNYHNFVVDGTQIIHLEGASTNKLQTNNKKRLIVTKSMFYFFRKHSYKINYIFFKIIYLLIRLLTIFSIKYTWKEKKEYIHAIIKA